MKSGTTPLKSMTHVTMLSKPWTTTKNGLTHLQPKSQDMNSLFPCYINSFTSRCFAHFKPKLLHMITSYTQLKHCLKLSLQRLSPYTNGLISLGPSTPKNFIKQVMVVEIFLTNFKKARNLVTTIVTIKLEGTVVDIHL